MKGFGTPPRFVSPASLESVTPDSLGAPALTDRGAETRTPRGPLQATVSLPPVGYPLPRTYLEVLKSSGSAAGYSAVSAWLTCPEQARLRALGVRRRPDTLDDKGKLDALTFGTIAHAIRAVRLAYGHVAALAWFWAVVAPEIPRPDADKLDLMFRIYESIYPLAADPWRVLGIEVEVITDLDGVVGPRSGHPVYRTVRYDTVIAHPDGGVYSFEAKTAARSSSMEQYNTQGMIQCALWNANGALTRQYGLMRGVLFDEFVKTETPKCERKDPKYYSKGQQAMALRYLLLADTVRYPVGPDGRYPQMLHACWGKYSPCLYISLCHDEAAGIYEYEDGSSFDGG